MAQKFKVGDKVLLDAKILRYVDNDRSAPAPYYQIGIGNGGIAIAFESQLHAMRDLFIHDTDKVVDAEKDSNGHYKEVNIPPFFGGKSA